VLRTVVATRYVTPLRGGGSVPALVEADDDGLYVLKFTGAAQGPKALVAELLVGELARSLGLPVPELVLVEVDPTFGRAEPDPELQTPMLRSGGLNLGMDFLPGALPFDPAVPPAPAPDLAADIVWFDALTTNIDRTARNPNLLVWHRRLQLIDHGAALYIHHTWRDPMAHARRSFPGIRDHVLLPFAGSIAEADGRLAARIDRTGLTSLVELIPSAWLAPEAGLPDATAHRDAYVDYLTRRLAEPRPFVEEADDARAA
jgi:HipA-like protein